MRVTIRLTTSPACLVADEYGMSGSLRTPAESQRPEGADQKPILEINPHHPIILKVSNETGEQKFSDWAYVLFDQSTLTLGEQLDYPVAFVNRLNGLLAGM